jgi:DNA-directed RNA polymerase specialized sigma24 family protein
MKSHKFKDDLEVLEFIKWEVRKYTGCYKDDNKVLFAYNRLTVEELAQEVYVKLLRTVSTKGLNKKYVRQAVVFTCIDEYRRFRVYDYPGSLEELEEQESPQERIEVSKEDTYGLTERLMQLDIFTDRELEVVLLLMEGHRNPEVRDLLSIPKMTYYTLLKRIRAKYIETCSLEEADTLINNLNNLVLEET